MYFPCFSSVPSNEIIADTAINEYHNFKLILYREGMGIVIVTFYIHGQSNFKINIEIIWSFQVQPTTKAPWTDFLKENYFVQPKCSDWKFCAETCCKNVIKICETREKKKTFSNYDKYLNLVAVFPVLRWIVKNVRTLTNILRKF